MILLDTNVLSELLRPAPEGRVLTWMAAQPRATLFTTSVTRGEMLYGIKVLPDGRRQQGFLAAILAIFNEELAGQVLNFDSDAADAYAEIAARSRSLGKPISQFDAMIAAIARSRGAHLATRNVKDFVECGIDIVDPWG
ncbi:type II toxin-antitoxin system VapC family toxin [Cupriavidus sp. CV2]|uniref:type II toxin-antitoxin system VapC family toxin n=1 Tax=Cupriavidus ulmosensis TaxID=3065913 RepID=UPI00296AF479|nr:type II toxin-antitoxin system VapC family toxin [Cupriavidus sp. CV2]MDW3680713.1 type II toxin-antitoxin system VapC family toxin [Cupriavidus sp. CV2]